MAKLFLVRHGETGKKGYHGHQDIGLSPLGVEQAEKLADRLAPEKIEAAYSSDLQRALCTARPIASRHNIEVMPCSELRELNFGRLEGLDFEQALKSYPQLSLLWSGEDLEANIPGGESLSQLLARLSRFLSQLQPQTLERNILIVAHGGPLRALLCLLLGLDLKHWWQIGIDNASLTIVETSSERVVLSLLNDICHLKGEK